MSSVGRGALARSAFVPPPLLAWPETAEPWRVVESSLVFLDLSGFTALSERLSRIGRQGTEELRDAIDGVMGALLGAAGPYGSEMLAYGGDALLLQFEGIEHERRAAAAATAMRSTLRGRRVVHTSVGRVVLGASMGIAAGPVCQLVCGTRAHYLVTAGSTTSEVLELEHAAGTGEICVSPAMARALDRRDCRDGRLIRARIDAPTRRTKSQRRNRQVDACLPPAISRALAAGEEPGHRHVVVGFIKAGGLDALIDGHGPAEAHAVVGDLVTTIEDAGDATVLTCDTDIDGVKVVVIAGAPVAGDADPDAVLLAARAAVEWDGPLEVRAGVHADHLFAGDLGSPTDRAYTTLGDGMNLSARLMARARPGTVLTSPHVVARARTSFAVASVPPFNVKGKRLPVHAVEVGPAGAASLATRGAVDLVGREAEWATLTTALEAAAAGLGAAIDLIAEPGLGKSALAEAAMAAAADWRVCVAGAGVYGRRTPYFAFREPLARLLGVTGPTAAERGRALRRIAPTELRPWLPLAADVLDAEVAPTVEVDALTPENRRVRLHATLAGLLDAAATPLLLVAEDAHWLDEASVALLGHLAREAAGRPWLVVQTRRPEGPPLPGATTITLDALDDAAAQRLVDDVVGPGTLRPDRVRKLVSHAAGNPLFLRELLTTSDDGELPSSVEAVVTRRLDLLDVDERMLVRRASVLGIDLDHAVLDDVLGPGTGDRLLRIGDFVEASGVNLRFRHAVVREAAYSSLSFAERRRLHGRAASAYMARQGDDNRANAGVVALHAARAGDWDRAWTFGLLASDDAKERGACAEAEANALTALKAVRHLDLPPSDIAHAWWRVASARAFLGRQREAIDAMRRALPGVEQHYRSQLHDQIGSTYSRAGEPSLAVRWLRRGIADPATTPEQRVGLETTLAGVEAMRGRLDHAARLSRRCLAAATELGLHYERAAALAHLHTVLSLRGASERVEVGATLLEVMESLPTPEQGMALGNLAADAQLSGRWDEATKLYERATREHERCGNEAGHALVSANLGELLVDRGDLDRARPVLDHVWRFATPNGLVVVGAFVEMQRARIDALEGRLDDATTRLDAAEATMRTASVDVLDVDIALRRAEFAYLDGDASAAAEISRELLARAGARAPRVARVLALALAALGDFDGAADHASRAVAGAQGAERALGEYVRSAVEGEPDLSLLDGSGIVTPPPLRPSDVGEGPATPRQRGSRPPD